MKIFLDDERTPEHIYSVDNFYYGGWEVHKTIETIKPLLEQGLVTHLSLDNDLGLGIEPGYRLVDWMVESGHWPTEYCMPHSANVVAFTRMLQDIKKYFRPKV